MGLRITFDNIFGHHNLTSDTEPEEMLVVERKKVQEAYRYPEGYADPTHNTIRSQTIGIHSALKKLFGDKCLHDEEKPKFKVGDKVRVVSGLYKGKVAQISFVCEDDPENTYMIADYETFNNRVWFIDNELEPYTEDNPIVSTDDTKDDTKETMEEKELDCRALYNALCDLESASIKVRKALVSFHERKEGEE